MAEFSATANLDVVVSQDSLRSAKREIERELGDVQVGVETDRPTGGGGGGVGGGRASTAAMLEIQRRTLVAQQSSADFDEERNEILLDMLETLEGGEGGGGGAARMAGTAGLAVGATSALGSAVASPFAALAAFTLGTAALGAFTPGAGGNDAVGPGPTVPPTSAPDTGPFGAKGNPFISGPGRFGSGGLMTTTPPDESPLAGGKVENNIDTTVNVGPTESMQRSEVQRFVQQRIRQAAEQIKNDIQNQIGSGTGARTGGGAFAAKGNPFNRQL